MSCPPPIAAFDPARPRTASFPPDLIPDPDSLVVARRTAAFVAELGDAGEVGRVLAGRAAFLSVRLERAAERELVAVAAGVAAGHARFDRDRAAELAEQVDALAAPGDPGAALATLAGSPAGVDHLLGAWSAVRVALAAGDPAAAGQARRWLGCGDGAGPAAGELAARVAAEVDRLAALARTMTPEVEAIAAARRAAGLLASFDPGTAATLARRHEAAAERGMFRALRAIAEIRRARARALGIAEPAAPPQPPAGTEVLASRAVEPSPSLGSFRADVVAGVARPAPTRAVGASPPPLPAEPRPTRPDYRQLDRKRR